MINRKPIRPAVVNPRRQYGAETEQRLKLYSQAVRRERRRGVLLYAIVISACVGYQLLSSGACNV
jgi:hypothetical protein